MREKQDEPIICGASFWGTQHQAEAEVNQATERIVDLYKESGYSVFLVPVRRSISASASTRGPVDEVLAFRGLDRARYPQDLRQV